MELKLIYQIIFILFILILFTVILYLKIKFKGKVSDKKNRSFNETNLTIVTTLIDLIKKNIINFTNESDKTIEFIIGFKIKINWKEDVFIAVEKILCEYNIKCNSEKFEIENYIINDQNRNRITYMQNQVKSLVALMTKIEIMFENNQYNITYDQLIEFINSTITHISSIDKLKDYKLKYNHVYDSLSIKKKNDDNPDIIINTSSILTRKFSNDTYYCYCKCNFFPLENIKFCIISKWQNNTCVLKDGILYRYYYNKIC